MRRISLSLILCAGLIFTSCKNEKEKNDLDDQQETEVTTEMETEKEEVKKVKVSLQPVSNSKLSGNVVFTEENGKVAMTAIISGLAEGKHAIHIHENGDCSAADGSSAGGHWNPTGQPHGKWGSSDGYHKGDIGNFDVDANGNGTVNLTTSEWCIGCDDKNKDLLGKAVIVHDGVDDYTSQPSGAAGTRVGCGVIKK
ncbi:superoxide dismutase family protein [Christiangramia sabulilitoris]|uniref:Superoxide dismutase family protein n=1 Tax=Christiangramia sabulilitoris TaxID=2583991 RepID=A0A550I6W1_9FLAO|nr:superoxide dismutase family protein [Christiangramia sabulilitoris]TRO66712.1 superoxide dismutase family protein [Christiangramia sabulilitoris]